MKSRGLIPPFLALVAVVATACTEDTRPTLALTGATVWDGTGGPARVADILVVDGRITEVGHPSIPSHATVYDFSGRWIIPGLVETHAHVSGFWAPDQTSDPMERVEEELGLFALYGVTTVSSLGDEPPSTRRLRDSQDTPSLRRARVTYAGPVITAVTPAEARDAVAENAASEVDWMKIRVDDNLGTTEKMPWETVEAVMEASHERGFRLATHLFYLDDAKRLLRMGTDLVAHSIRDVEVDEEVIGLFRETGTCYVPTLTREVSAFVYGERPDFFDEKFFRMGAKRSEIDRVSEPAFMEGMRESRAAALYRVGLDQALVNLKRLSDAGIPIAFGTDVGPAGRFPGYFEHLELELMVQAGLTPEEALASATRVAASCLEMPDVGTLEAGMWADLLVLGANPLEDITATKTLEKVFIAGNEIR